MDKIFYKKVHRFDRTQTMNEIEYIFRLRLFYWGFPIEAEFFLTEQGFN